MTGEIIQVFGLATYLVFFVLFIWARRIPRTNPGSGWWAISIACALCSRLLFFLLLPTQDTRLIVTAYAAVNILEKPILVTGLVRFLNLKSSVRWVWILAGLAEGWLLLAWVADFSPLARMAGYSVVNGVLLLWAAWAAWQHQGVVPGHTLLVTAASSLLTAVHWISSPFLIHMYPAWLQYAFMLGILLVMIQYMSLLAAILSLFQQRLTESETSALNLAFQDPLTGLNNQRYMSTLFTQALLLATRPHHIVAIFYIDLDNFKPVNDTAGHATGDEVLKTIANRLKASVRSTDICARVGGDEFVVIGTQLIDESHVSEMAKKLLAQTCTPVVIGANQYTLGASIGVALYPQHGQDLTQLMKYADEAMYQIKHGSKSGYCIHQGLASQG